MYIYRVLHDAGDAPLPSMYLFARPRPLLLFLFISDMVVVPFFFFGDAACCRLWFGLSFCGSEGSYFVVSCQHEHCPFRSATILLMKHAPIRSHIPYRILPEKEERVGPILLLFNLLALRGSIDTARISDVGFSAIAARSCYLSFFFRDLNR